MDVGVSSQGGAMALRRKFVVILTTTEVFMNIGLNVSSQGEAKFLRVKYLEICFYV